MLLKYLPNLFLNPKTVWADLRGKNFSIGSIYLTFILPLALIIPIVGYIGTTSIGWHAGTEDSVYLAPQSATTIALLLFLSELLGVAVLAYLIQWMSDTYGFKREFANALLLAAFIATPLFICGAFLIFGEIWAVYIASLAAITFSVRILYSGVPKMMELPDEKGFLLSSAILCVGLVVFVAILAASAILWNNGVETQFIR